MRVLALLLIAACSFEPSTATPGSTDSPPPNDGPLDPDAGPDPDGPVDSFVGPPPSACVTKWLTMNPLFVVPDFVPQTGSGGQALTLTIDERDPFISSDQLHLYFSRVDGANLDILRASRATDTAPFGQAGVLESLTDQGQEDGKVTMTGDDLIAFIATRRGGGEGAVDLWEASRGTPGITAFANFTQAHLANVNDAANQRDPHISPDGLRLYFAAGDPQKIVVSSRASLADNFGAPQEITEVNGAAGDADPTLTADERVILFTRRDSGGSTDLFYATRTERDQPFGTPQPVSFNSPDLDADPQFTGDGCTVYFSSTRFPMGDDFDLFVTKQL